jgi:F-type H+-transporting ATPase subunit c
MMKFWMIALVTVGMVFGTVSVASAQPEQAPAAAEGGESAKAPPAESLNKGLVALATGLAIAIAAFGGALGQGRAAAAALEGVARNPGARKDLFVPFILALALIESLVIYALIIAFQLAGKVG